MSLLREFSQKQRRIIGSVIVIAVIATCLGYFLDFGKVGEEVTRLIRPAAYEEAKEVSLTLHYKGGEGEGTYYYKGLLGKRKLGDLEQKTVLREALDFVEKGMLREGETLDGVKTGIMIPDRIDGNPALIRWNVDNQKIFLENGDIRFEQLGSEPVVTKLFVTALYGEREEKREYILKVLPPSLSQEEKNNLFFQHELDRLLDGSEDKEAILPNQIGGFAVSYVREQEGIAESLAGMGILAILFTYAYLKRENKRAKEKREEELKEAYPFFVGRFVILLGAGLNILSIWQKLEKTENFNKSLSREIRLTMWEISNGKAEREAYERFGRRIGGKQYPKFISILTENLKMGSSQILTRLSSEAKDAMLERRNAAREIGEKMGTKFLMPMMVELVLIMLIIMLPAMMSAG